MSFVFNTKTSKKWWSVSCDLEAPSPKIWESWKFFWEKGPWRALKPNAVGWQRLYILMRKWNPRTFGPQFWLHSGTQQLVLQIQDQFLIVHSFTWYKKWSESWNHLVIKSKMLCLAFKIVVRQIIKVTKLID